MATLRTFSDMRVWIIFGIICALVMGPVGDFSSTLLIIVLIIQMTISIDSLSLNTENLRKNKRPILLSVIACFGISTIVTLSIGSLFIADHPEIWAGWVMLAAVPCAVSTVTMSFLVKGNTTMCVLSLAAIYLIALVLTPLIAWTLIGESVSVTRVFLYVILFVAVPMAASVPMKKVKINRKTRVVAINIMMFVMVALSIGQNRDYLFSEPGTVVLVVLACIVRIFVVSFAILHILKKRGSNRDNSMVYLPMAVWKNSGLSMTLCFVIMGAASEAALPCAISMLVEVSWFAVMMSYIEKVWPGGKDTALSSNG